MPVSARANRAVSNRAQAVLARPARLDNYNWEEEDRKWLGKKGRKARRRGDGRTTGILLAEELAHARLPPPALVERHAPVLGAAPGEPRALPPEHVNELLLAQVAHLLVDQDVD